MSRDRPPPNRSDPFPERFPDDRDPGSWTGDGRGDFDDFAPESGLPDFAGVGPDTNAFLQALEEEPDELFRPGPFGSNGSNGTVRRPASDRGGFGDEPETSGLQPEYNAYPPGQQGSNGFSPAETEPEFYAEDGTSGGGDWIEANPYPQPPTHRDSAPISSEIERFERENGYVDNRPPAEPLEQPHEQGSTSHRGGFDDDVDDDEFYSDDDAGYAAPSQEYDEYVDGEYYEDEEAPGYQQQARDDFRASVFDQNIDYYQPNQQQGFPEPGRGEDQRREYGDAARAPFQAGGADRDASAGFYDDDGYDNDGYDADGYDDDEDVYYDDYPQDERYPAERQQDSRRSSTRQGSYSPGPDRIFAKSNTSSREPRSRLRRSAHRDKRSQGFVVEQKSREHRIRDQAIELAFLVVPTILLVLLVRAFVVSPLIVPTESMEPTLEVGDRVLVNKLSYRVGEIGRGDLVVARDTTTESGKERNIVKRVIGLPGEVVEIKDNTVIINGNRQLDETDYLAEDVSSEDFGPVRVPQGEIFVMGDNRQASSDSRNELGTVPVEMVEGRAFLRWWPAGRFGAL